MRKLVEWYEKYDKNDGLSIFTVAVFTWLACFIKPIIGRTYTSWDTHDLAFVNFLYFSDALKEGYIPLWNHFIQSGTFFPHFFNIGIYSPFQLIFVVLSWFISPVYTYELMLQAAAIVGGIGAYLLIRTGTQDRMVALFGATAFSAVVLVPVVGQIMFLFSLSSFPWILLGCMKIMQSTNKGWLRYVLWGTLLAMYISSGYVWMNFINMCIAVIFAASVWGKTFFFRNTLPAKAMFAKAGYLLIFFAAISTVYGSLELPGYFNMQHNYHWFSGDYDSPEPRLRSLSTQGHHYSYSTIYKAMVGAVDPRIVINDGPWQADLPKWSWGGGWVLWILILAITTRKRLGQQMFWMVIIAVTLIYSAGDSNFAGKYIERTPILNANRWWFIGVIYTTIALVFLAIPKVLALKERAGRKQTSGFWSIAADLQIIVVGASSAYLLWFFKSQKLEYALVGVIIVAVLLLGRVRNRIWWKNLLIILMGVNVMAIAYMPYGIPAVNHYLLASGEGGYTQQIRERRQSVVITENHRRLGDGEVYIFNDEEWLKKKIPFSHGYNPLGNPLYWYVKNDPFVSSIVTVTQMVRKEAQLKRADFKSDGEFAEALMADVLMDAKTPTVGSEHFEELPKSPDFKWEIKNLNLVPNAATMRVETNAAAYLIFNDVYAPGWEVYLNGEPAEMLITNRVFKGVVLDSAGAYEVEFKYQPKLMIALILLPYLVLLLYAGVFLLNRLRRRDEESVEGAVRVN